MYSVVLAALLSTAGAAPDWGWYYDGWWGYPAYSYYPVYYTPWSYYPFYGYYPVWPYATPPAYASAPVPGPAVAAVGGADRAHITVRLPADAQLFVDDVPDLDAGRPLSFDTPPLQPGRTYAYTLRATVRREGQPYAERRRITFQAGGQVTVDFSAVLAGNARPPEGVGGPAAGNPPVMVENPLPPPPFGKARPPAGEAAAQGGGNLVPPAADGRPPQGGGNQTTDVPPPLPPVKEPLGGGGEKGPAGNPRQPAEEKGLQGGGEKAGNPKQPAGEKEPQGGGEKAPKQPAGEKEPQGGGDKTTPANPKPPSGGGEKTPKTGKPLPPGGGGEKPPGEDKAPKGGGNPEPPGGDKAPKSANPQPPPERLEGLWLLDHSEHGKFTTTVSGFTPVLLFKGDQVTKGRIFPGETDVDKHGSGPYKLDASKHPKTIDITLKEGEEETTRLGIYKLDGDDLVIALGEPGAKERPQEFDSDKAEISYYYRSKK